MSDEKALKDFDALVVAVAREEATLPSCETMGGVTLRSHILTLRELASTAAAERARDVAAERRRREQAERERDEARAECERLRRRGVEDDEARERAEADNAKYIRALNLVEHLIINGRAEEARQEAIWVMEPDHPGAAMLERMRAVEAVLAKFRQFEWARGDWQGLCPFRRHKDVGCLGTDGRVAAVGTPTPVPHAEHCPYHALTALNLETT